jgi:DNA-binding NarL/FixJ family response regulator
MTTRETAYQTFAFTKVTFNHKEPLTETERKVYHLHQAGHADEQISAQLGVTLKMVEQHLRTVVHKGWIDG